MDSAGAVNKESCRERKRKMTKNGEKKAIEDGITGKPKGGWEGIESTEKQF